MVVRGEIFLANLEPIKGSEQGGVRPCLIIQNDISNSNSPVTIIAAITSKSYEKEFPTNVFVSSRESGLGKDSTILLNQMRTIDKIRLIKKVGSLNLQLMKNVDMALKVSLSLN